MTPAVDIMLNYLANNQEYVVHGKTEMVNPSAPKEVSTQSA